MGGVSGSTFEIHEQGPGVPAGSSSKFSLKKTVPHAVAVGVGVGVVGLGVGVGGGGIVGVAGGVGSMGSTKIVLLVPVMEALLVSVAVIVRSATM